MVFLIIFQQHQCGSKGCYGSVIGKTYLFRCQHLHSLQYKRKDNSCHCKSITIAYELKKWLRAWPRPKSLETSKSGSGLKFLLPKIGFRFNYNDESVSCACSHWCVCVCVCPIQWCHHFIIYHWSTAVTYQQVMVMQHSINHPWPTWAGWHKGKSLGWLASHCSQGGRYPCCSQPVVFIYLHATFHTYIYIYIHTLCLLHYSLLFSISISYY